MFVYKFIKNKYFFHFFCALLGTLSSFCNAQDNIQPAVHVLMPAYNANKFVLSAIRSVLDQNYSNFKLLIFNDGSTDETLKKIQILLKDKPVLKNRIYLRSMDSNVGVSQARTALIKWSKNTDPSAYIFWLDADDKYTNKSYISDVIQKIQATKADICLVNFSIIYEDESQKNNAAGLIKDKEKMAKIIKTILSSPTQSINPLELSELLETTSLGWVKCYAPTVVLPQPINCPFEDFVYMASLLEVNTITALPAENEPIQYLRRSNSICGQRKSKNFTNDIPNQLTKFFDVVLENSMHQKDQLQKVEMAQKFVSRKLMQYLDILEKIIEAKSNANIDQKTLEIYRKKGAAIEKYINEKIKTVVRS